MSDSGVANEVLCDYTLNLKYGKVVCVPRENHDGQSRSRVGLDVISSYRAVAY